MPKLALLRRDGMGGNCHHVSDNFKGMMIGTADEIPADVDWVLRWGTTSNLKGNPKIINKARAIHETTDKGTFRAKCAAQGLAPRVWFSLEEFLNDPYEDFNYAIVRPTTHQRSQDIYFCTDLTETKKACKKLGEGNYYISEFINKQKEWRVFVVSGRIICLLDKVPRRGHKGDVSWGFADFTYVNWSQWPIHVAKNAIDCFNLSELDFAALDIISVGDKAYFLEANTAPEVWPYYGGKLADALKYIIENGRDRIPLGGDATNWKHFIHPSTAKAAIL